jgi:hypothetical protein
LIPGFGKIGSPTLTNELETLDDDEIAELDELARLETLDDDEITELDELVSADEVTRLDELD